jgi:HNH endonuclease
MADKSIHKSIRDQLGRLSKLSDAELLSGFRDQQRHVCKPCWELKYCPYGPVVEHFPLLPPTRKVAQDHNEYLKNCLETGVLGSGERLDEKRRKSFQSRVREFDPGEYPASIPKVFEEIRCKIYGHLCPVYFVSEAFTETSEFRQQGRSIPFPVRARVARRDNYTCQVCGKHLKDEELEFDHLIPLSKGGSSDEHNIRLTCIDCNRRKAGRYDPSVLTKRSRRR